MAHLRMSPEAAARLAGKKTRSTTDTQLVRENAERWVELSELRVELTRLQASIRQEIDEFIAKIQKEVAALQRKIEDEP